MGSPESQKSVFTGHQLKSNSISWTLHHQYPDNWVSVSFLMCLIIIAWVHVFYNKRVHQIYYAPLARRFLNILSKEGNLFKERLTVALFLVYLFTYAFVISKTISLFAPVKLSLPPEYHLCILISAFLLVFWFFKIVSIRFLGIVFKTKEASRDYLLNLVVFCLMTGMILLPVLILSVFLNSRILLYSALIIIALLFFFRVLRGLLIGISLKKFSYLFLFAYLCALEILPLLVILKGLYIFSSGF